ncbi:multiprotein-bridging factor 1c [Tanacetum coccineum]
MGAMSQDWEPVVLHKSKPKSQTLRDSKSINQALRAGAQVETIKKHDGGTNKKGPGTAVYARKLDEAEEPAAIERVGAEVRQMIQKARIENKMSQAELAKRINERPQVVQEYENGKAVPNQGVLAKMERYEKKNVKEILESSTTGHKDKDRVMQGAKWWKNIVLMKFFKEIEVMEAMKFGVPIIAMQMHLDHPVNARLVVEIEMGKEVVRNVKGVLMRTKVTEIVNEVVASNLGKNIRDKAKKISEDLETKGDEEIKFVMDELL